MSPAHVIQLIEHSQVVYRIEHSAPVQAAGVTLISVLVTWAVTLFLTRKRIAWRVYTDDEFRLDRDQARSAGEHVSFNITVTPPEHPENPEQAADPVRQEDVDKPWLVVLRIRNSGFAHLKKGDFDPPFSFIFPGRDVRHAEIMDSTDGAAADLAVERTTKTPAPQQTRLQKFAANWLPARLADLLRVTPPAKVTKPTVGVVHLTELALNRNARFTLMAVLSGDPPTAVTRNGRHGGTARTGAAKSPEMKRILHQGMLAGGKIVPEPPRRGPGNRSLAFGGGATLTLAGLLLGLFLSAPSTSGGDASCAGGALTLIGSTAFSPVAGQLADAYHNGCPAAHITVPAANNGSLNGLAALVKAGRAGKADGLIAMSDGPAPAGPQYSGLVGQSVAIIIFTVAVNTDVGVYNLSTDQIRGIFKGSITNWDAITHGSSIPIRIISREPGSGTRRAFDQYVLGGVAEQAGTDAACNGQSLPDAPVIWCTDSTTKLLQVVADITGAIGYAQVGDVTSYSGGGVQPVSLNGLGARFGDIGRTANTYPFWTAEYLYTYGKPSALASSFITHLTSTGAIGDLTTAGYAPCPSGGASIAARLCAQADS